MKRFVNILAVIGVVIIVGAVGKMDYMMETKIYFPLIETVKTMAVGFLFTVPAIISRRMN